MIKTIKSRKQKNGQLGCWHRYQSIVIRLFHPDDIFSCNVFDAYIEFSMFDQIVQKNIVDKKQHSYKIKSYHGFVEFISHGVLLINTKNKYTTRSYVDLIQHIKHVTIFLPICALMHAVFYAHAHRQNLNTYYYILGCKE